MSYNPTWVNPYLQPYSAYQSMPTQYSAGVQPVNGIVKVNGRDSAMQYQLPPNSTSPALFDQNGKTFYVVSTDGTGMKTVEAFDFSPHVDDKPIVVDGAEFVSRREFDEFAAKVNAVIGAGNVHGPVQADTEPYDGEAEPRQAARQRQPRVTRQPSYDD